jgi:putative transposase
MPPLRRRGWRGQKTKSKLTSAKENYSTTAFHYIHQNPFAAGMVKNPEEWAYSSYRDYAGLRNGTLCNRDKAYQLLDLASIDFKTKTLEKIDEEIIKKIH